MSEAYGIGWNEFLPALGLKVPARPRSLNIRPPWLWLLALKGQTGVAAAFIRGHMTFEQLSAGMAWFVHRATPCPICAANKPPGGLRHVEWLGDLAPWTLMCDRHPCPILASEAGRCHRRETINRDVKALACRPQSTAFSDPPRPFPSVPLSAAACVDMVEAINTRLKLHLREGQHGHAVFAVQDILMARQVDEASRPWLRNSRAVSAWYAWHVHAYPDVVLHRHTRCRDHDQTCDPLTMLYDFRHTGVISAEWEGQTVAGIALPAQARSRRLADGYLVAADAPSTVRAYAYTADWTHFSLWFASREVVPMPASPVLVGDYLSDLGEGYARSTLRRKVAAIARAYRHAGHPLDTRNPSIRDALRGIGRTHGSPPKRWRLRRCNGSWRPVTTALWACATAPCS